MGARLLETKLHAPGRRQTTIARPRLQGRLGAVDVPALTLISAPAGFGKTTAAVELFADNARAAWVSLDRRDNDAAIFWSYVVAALASVEPGIGDGLRPLLQAPLAAVEPVVAGLINDIDAIDGNVVLVLDDYHVIETPEIHEGLAFLLEHRPPQLRVVLVTRADPPLPLAVLRAKGELAELRANDLRFTEDEAAAYLTGAMGLALSEADVARLGGRTEGWAAALQLAALSMQGRDDAPAFVDGFSGDDRFILDYLVGEVLDRQSDEARAFLLQTSILERMTGTLCDAVCARSGSRAVLEELERANLFLVPLDDRRQWYRYHHLFADVLRARLLDEMPAAPDLLHVRAAEWFEINGEASDAIGHALSGRAWDLAARLIEVNAPAMRQARREAELRSWLEALPLELLADRPLLADGLAGARLATGDPTGVVELLDMADRRLADPARPVVFDEAEFAVVGPQIAVHRAGVALLAGDLDSAIAHAQDVLARTEATDHLQQGAATALLGLSYWAMGRLDESQVRYTEAIDHFVAAGLLSDVLGCSVALADMQIASGRLDDARATYERGLAIAASQENMRGVGDMHVGLAEVHLERGDVDAAAAEAQTARELGDASGLPQFPYRSRLASARIAQAQGDADRALALYDDADRRYDTDFSPPVRPVGAWRARLQIATGDLSAAEAWARSRSLNAEEGVTYIREFELLTFARLLLAQGSASEADALLRRVLAAADAENRPGAADEARALLARATETAAVAPVARKRSQGLVDELSERELDVLRLLRTDLSGPAIAAEMHVSLNTFRTHTKNIYMKLAVNNRREALTRANELGL